MDAIALTLAQAVMVAFQAAWLSIAAYSNIRYPRTNRDYVLKVLTMELAQEDPAIYQDHHHRRLTSPKVMVRLFALVSAAEALIALALWVAVALLLLSLSGVVSPAAARAVALLAVAGFTSIWAAFLVGGQWFHYWVSELSPQSTHFSMVLWGLAMLLLLK
jgi:predicted small integral membrane protein